MPFYEATSGPATPRSCRLPRRRSSSLPATPALSARPLACWPFSIPGPSQLLYHPHVHCLVTAGGVTDDGRQWRQAKPSFLVPIKALAKIVRGKLRAILQQRRPDLVLPPAVWRKPWIVYCTSWGQGEQAVLEYLARYVFRTAITNSRIVRTSLSSLPYVASLEP